MRLVHTPEVWSSIESDAQDAGMGVPEYIDALVSVIQGMNVNLAILRAQAEEKWQAVVARIEAQVQ